MKTLLDALIATLSAGEQLVTATIASRHGSAPRAAGSKMLVHANGDIMGTIGGGQLEGRTLVQARAVFESGHPTLLRFDLDSAEAAESDMICGGTVEILLERIDPDKASLDLFLELSRILARGENCLLVTPLGFQQCPHSVPDSKRILLPEGRLLGEPLDEPTANALLQRGCSFKTPEMFETGSQRYFLEPFVSLDTLYLVGAGHVSRSTAFFADRVGFRVVAMDDREAFLNRERFPEARELVILDSYKECFAGRNLGPSDAIVIVTRGHLHDLDSLAQALLTRAGYVGMIGSRRKVRTVFDQLRLEGTPEHDLLRVHSPIGLDIGAETPEEIGVSIVAELVAWRAARRGLGAKGALSGRPLRELSTLS
ncbi:MAG: XdhC family protein [Desulfovibrio sp.]|jgi:xanthine dehydrogenase accessory factor|nr:XdhC family protein [Desulfovibrio sp.]MBI4961152.1 XdhC family protein [Desulfovibrio sp.]